MRKPSFILSLFLLCSSLLSARTFTGSYEVDNKSVNNGYFIQKVWLDNYAVPGIRLVQPVFAQVQGVPDSMITGTPEQFDVVLGMERKRPFAFVRIPVYSRESQSQGVRALSSFSLVVEEADKPSDNLPQAKTTASSSVLASGSWYKIGLSEKGMYKIDYDFIKNKLGVNPDNINTAHIRVFGNGGRMLSENNAVLTPDDLAENAIQVFDGGDGVFNTNDYFVFYATGPMDWVKDSVNQKFIHRKNLYSDKAYYFLNFDQGTGLRVANASGPMPNVNVTDFNDFMVHEEDMINAGKFGKEWWGENFSTDPGKVKSRTFDFNLGNLTDSADIRILFGSKSTVSGNHYTVTLNSQLIGNYYMGAVGVDEESDPIIPQDSKFRLPLNNSASFTLEYTPATSTGNGYLNFIELNTRRSLALAGGQITFRDWKSVSAGNIAGYKLGNANNNVLVWDVTDPLRPVRMSGSLAGGVYSFSQAADMLHEFVAFDGSQYLTPEFTGTVANQDLHGSDQVDFIVVTHPDFLEAAKKIADFHHDKEGMRTIVATTDQIYNEFSSGAQDIGGIRDFARMFYKRAGLDTNEMPRYLLLLGDASYDYKDRLSGNSNYVPTYETAESIKVILGYCSDDYFSFLDDNENIENTLIANTMDIGVGRLPVRTEPEAIAAIDKIISYSSPASLGPWRVSTTILADNGDDNVHFDDGEIMAGTINNHSDLYNETKVYIASFPLTSTPGGDRAPEANKMINDQIFKGTFLMNYNGHGSIQTLAHERILTQDDFNNWKNPNKLPIMVTATCEFSRYDDPASVSAGEKLILKPDGGAIALLTTTQLVYQFLNRPMNVNFLNAQFRQYNDKWPTLGDAFRYSKNVSYATPHDAWTLANYRKFALLGDPALTPAFPRHQVKTEAILDGNTLLPADTIKALGKYMIRGKVTTADDEPLPEFNGRVYVTIFDKPHNVSTNPLSNLGSEMRSFRVQNNIIYKGKVTVTNGQFSFNFITPKDLNYDFGKGKISYYAENGITDAAGADTTVTVGGFSDFPVVDDDAPIVKPFINDSLFRDGGITGANTLLYAQLLDATGINVSGNSVGHDLTGVLDDDIQHPYILNDYYETAPNDFTRGYVNFPLTGLSEGRHYLTVKAWDMNNNSGEGRVYFEVINGTVVQVKNLMNYPNPFTDMTHFVFEHNHPGEKMNVQIMIYSTTGALVRTLKDSFVPEGSRSNEIVWDGTDNNGVKLSAGIYVYRMNLATEKGIQASAYQKLVLVR